MQYSQLSQQGSSAISSGVGGSAGGIHVQMQADASYFQAQVGGEVCEHVSGFVHCARVLWLAQLVYDQYLCMLV